MNVQTERSVEPHRSAWWSGAAKRLTADRCATALRGVGVAVLVGLAGCAGSDRPDTVYINGKIITVNPSFDIVEALAVEDGRITALGTDATIEALAGPGTRRVDLRGNTVLPGFNDSHVHVGIGRAPEVRDWTGLNGMDELRARLRERAARTPDGEWIQAHLRNEAFPETVIPDRYELDRLVPDHPVVLTRGAHVMMLNSRGLERAGITRSTQVAPGGTIEFDERGEPTGILRERAAWRIALKSIPRSPPPPEQAREALLATLDRLPPLGITSMNAAGVRPLDLRYLQQLYDDRGERLVRMTTQLRVWPGYDAYDDLDEAIAGTIDELEAMGVHTGFGNDRLKLGAVKMSIDGGLTGQAFWSSEPYPDKPGFTGLVRIPEQALYPVAHAAHEMGWQLGIHAIGDAAVEMVVDVLDRILRESPRQDHRHFLHHVSVRPPPATLDAMARNSIGVSSQPNFATALNPYVESALRDERLEHNNPQKSLLERGIWLAHGSDGMPLGPLYGIYSAVTRKAPNEAVHGPQERLDIEEAIRAYTIGVAYMNFDEEIKGSLEPGKVADMVVLGEDILSVDPERIKDIPVVMTIVGDRVLYGAEPTPAPEI